VSTTTDQNSRPVAGLVERTVRPLLDRLRAGCTDWDGTEMADKLTRMQTPQNYDWRVDAPTETVPDEGEF
jgi:hypothetical protein